MDLDVGVEDGANVAFAGKLSEKDDYRLNVIEGQTEKHNEDSRANIERVREWIESGESAE